MFKYHKLLLNKYLFAMIQMSTGTMNGLLGEECPANLRVGLKKYVVSAALYCLDELLLYNYAQNLYF